MFYSNICLILTKQSILGFKNENNIRKNILMQCIFHKDEYSNSIVGRWLSLVHTIPHLYTWWPYLVFLGFWPRFSGWGKSNGHKKNLHHFQLWHPLKKWSQDIYLSENNNGIFQSFGVSETPISCHQSMAE